MKQLEEIGNCPNCECSLIIYKTNNYKRFVKCDVCELSYPLPKRGKISNSALKCPKNGFPVLIIEKTHQKAYFWSDQPCFSCIAFDKCTTIQELTAEFREMQVYGY